MQSNKNTATNASFRKGDLVRVKGPAEILKTLDDKGQYEGVPFMPEMLKACGKTFTVYARADKTCDTATKTGGRRLHNSVHLDGERCDGSSHGGCQAECLNFWKEAWLVNESEAQSSDQPEDEPAEHALQELSRYTTIPDETSSKGEPIYSCQATLLPQYTTPLPWWDIRQYWRDLTSGNIRFSRLLKVAWLASYSKLVSMGIGYRFWVSLYDRIQAYRQRQPWPKKTGLAEISPVQLLDLTPGEVVRIKSYPEILPTINSSNKNRGLFFDTEMVRYCGQTHRVHSRVERIINEATGEMMHFSNPCIILENVWCASEWSVCRRHCPRSIYHYWREIWLEKTTDG